MWERFSDRHKRAIRHAVELAHSMGASAVEPEHLLIGLLHDPESTASRLLARMGIVPLEVQRVVRLKLRMGRVQNSMINFSERSKELLYQASRQSEILQDSYIGTEHMLQGMALGNVSGIGSLLPRIGIRYQPLTRALHVMREEEKQP